MITRLLAISVPKPINHPEKGNGNVPRITRIPRIQAFDRILVR
jgi:hypothetical protein